jgi:hypothetical protein
MFVFRKPFFIIAPDPLSWVIASRVSMHFFFMLACCSFPDLIFSVTSYLHRFFRLNPVYDILIAFN